MSPARPRTLPFEKWEGLGNDFVLVESAVWAASGGAPDLSRALCDRRRGVGADGVLVVDAAAPRMVVYNADGTRPEMCGNGLRCVAGYLAGRGPDGGEPRLVVETDAGPKACAVVRHGLDSYDVTVEMGVARIGGELEVPFEGRVHPFRRVDMGNPHAVTFAPYDDEALDALGPRVSTYPEGGVNVEFCKVRSGEAPGIDVVVWERGAGRTLACGTGACAVAAVACELGRAAYGEPVHVILPGGELLVTVDGATLEVSMRGPARRVFTGQARLP